MSEEINERMDVAAGEALVELREALAAKTALDLFWVADWWQRWYKKAGHKRLGRILLQYAR